MAPLVMNLTQGNLLIDNTQALWARVSGKGGGRGVGGMGSGKSLFQMGVEQGGDVETFFYLPLWQMCGPTT